MNSMEHPLDDLIASSADDELTPALLAHLDECDECRAIFEELRTAAGSVAPPVEPGFDENAVSEARRVVALMTEEQERARQWLQTHPGEPDSGSAGTLARYGAGGVKAVLDHTRALIPRDAASGLKWADVAIDLANGNDSWAYPEETIAQIKGEAWKDRANALRLLSRYDEALEAIARASSEFEELVVSEPWIAMADYVRGTILREMGRYEESLQLAKSVAPIFRRYGYSMRARHARILEAASRHRLGDYRGAREISQQLLSDATITWEIADLHLNIGNANLELGNFEEAASHYEVALPIFAVEGWKAAAVQVHWGMARILLFQGQPAEAIQHLQEIRDGFDALEMSEESALVGLDIVEGLIVADLPGAADLSRELVEFFARRGETPALRRAFAYLKESSDEHVPTREAIVATRRKIRSARSRPRLFVEPPLDNRE